MAVKTTQSDLEFILQQIKIAEAHAGGASLYDLVGNPLLPYGLRTVDGTYNNLVPGQEQYGSADQVMPRLLDTSFAMRKMVSMVPAPLLAFPVQALRPATNKPADMWWIRSRGSSVT